MSSAIWSVYTDGITMSVYSNRIADGIYRILKKNKQFDDVDFFFRRFYQRNDQGIQTGISVQ
jgi:hypothetical protein